VQYIPSQPWRRPAIVVTALALVLLGGLALHLATSLVLGATLKQGVYVWQYAWTPEVDEAVARAADAFDAFYPVCAEVSMEAGAWDTRRAYPGWGALQDTGAAVWPVFRARNAITPRIAADPEGVAHYFAELTRTVAEEAERAGVRIAGIQLDYDCPTESLPQYALLTAALQRALPRTPLSITALPTWLGQSSFRDVLAPVVHYTLQVHGLDRPMDVHAAAVLCDTARVPGWLEKAEALGHPFHLALPTYTYRLYFAPSGEFAGIAAEGASEAAPGFTAKDARADPEAIAAVVRALYAKPTPNCLGIHWFRLPVARDRLNWTWPVLASVMRGVAPVTALTAEIRTPQPGLHEVWLRNDGAHTPAGTVRLPLNWTGGPIAADDALGGYRLTARQENSVLLTGPPPAPGEERMTAWLRMDNDGATLAADDVEMVE
jgi:hypothetical protein